MKKEKEILTQEELKALTCITKRAKRLLGYNKINLALDILCAHENNGGIRLIDLSLADEFNFIRDVVGITKYLNKNTGKFNDGFSPSFSK